MRKALILLLLAILLAGAAAPASARPALHEDEPHLTSLPELEEALREAMFNAGAPGLSIVVVENGEVTWEAGLGVLDRETRQPASADSIFRTGSVSKLFVSLAVMQLVEEGQLSLDDRLADLAPEIEFSNPWEASHPVRLVHLLEHTTGFEDMSLREYAVRDADIRLGEALAINPAPRTSRWQPGLFFSYSNIGPAIAAYLVEKETGMPFEAYVQENIFDPLGMAETTYFYPQPAERLSRSYGPAGQEIPFSHIIFRPPGSVSTTPADMGRLIQMLLERGQSILSTDSIELIETPTSSLAAAQGLRLGMAKGNFTGLHKGFVFHGHDGGIDGFSASLGYLPEARLGYYISINGGGGSLDGMVEMVRDYLTRDLAPPEPPPAVDPFVSGQERYAGYYASFTPRSEFFRAIETLTGVAQVSLSSEGLVVRPLLGGEALDLLPVAEGLYRGRQDSQARIAFAEHAGYGRTMLIEGGLGGNLRQAPGWSVAGRLVLAAAVLLLAASAVLYALVWVPLRLLRRSGRRPDTWVRLLPLLASLSLLLLAGLTLGGFVAGLEFLGLPTALSLSIFGLSILFALLTLAALAASLQALRREEITLPVKIYSLLVSLALALAAVYLTAMGWIGLRTWV
jgi:CubicO group peptidase (beta-lactamase class C family)